MLPQSAITFEQVALDSQTAKNEIKFQNDPPEHSTDY
jgi:hypothetical protein